MKKEAQVSIFIIIAIILAVGIAFIFVASKNKVELNGKEFECKTDSDCVKVQTTCCPCNMGGEEICTAKDKADLYKVKEEECPTNLICTALFNCKIESCSCINGKCAKK